MSTSAHTSSTPAGAANTRVLRLTRKVTPEFTLQPVKLDLPEEARPRTNLDDWFPWILGKPGEKGAVLIERVGIGGHSAVFFVAVFADITPEFLANLLRNGFKPGGLKSFRPTEGWEASLMRQFLN